MNEKVIQSLNKLFEKYRVVFWYDSKKELRAEFESVVLPGIEKLEIKNNQFGLKHKILREMPETRFLLYHEGAAPADTENWLLDIQLAGGEFRADQTALLLCELGLGNEFAAVVNAHMPFFQSARRLESLKNIVKPGDTAGGLLSKMTAVCVNADNHTDDILFCLLDELANGGEEKIALLKRCGLDQFLWEQLKKLFGYNSPAPGIKDFAIELFKSCYAGETGAGHSLNNDAAIFFKRWKDGRSNKNAFEKLSEESAAVLNIAGSLAGKDFRNLMEIDYFKEIDQKIIEELIKAVTEKSCKTHEISAWVRGRRPGFWYEKYGKIYEAVDYAARLTGALDESDLNMGSMDDGIQRYSESWFKIDQYYRKFIYSVRASGEVSVLEPLIELIEKLYTNNFLLKMNDYWQSFVDGAVEWKLSNFTMQRNFFIKHIKPFIDKDNKIFVIISDAFRYEIGDELLSLIRQEDRFEAAIEPLITMLPSYTQLGMAALLPNNELMITDDDSGTVFVDSQNSQGEPNRSKILGRAITGGACAISAEKIMGLNRDECRALVRDNNVLYVYHNTIDAAGDKIASENKVFESVENTIQEIIRLIKKLTSANASNIIVTADHGFIYQNGAVNENDFALNGAEGDEILYRDRRFVLGRGLKANNNFKKFAPAELGLAGTTEVMLPKSINRLRLSGSGSRYVHGGSSLQEIVVPVVKINKKRQSDISTTEVEIIRGSSSIITSGQLSVVFYQELPVTDKIKARTLRGGIYNQAGELISDSHDITFDFISENAREREKTAQFILTKKAESANNQEVTLKLEEKVHGTSQYQEYKSLKYTIRRAFGSDFDF